jgi:hypothetical protein
MILYSVYIYKTLLSPDPAIGALLPSASDTNLVVSLLSQVLANSIDMLLTGVFDVLRWQLAARFAGVSATTFFQLSSSTQWLTVFFLTITKLSSSGVGFIRYHIPVNCYWFPPLTTGVYYAKADVAPFRALLWIHLEMSAAYPVRTLIPKVMDSDHSIPLQTGQSLSTTSRRRAEVCPYLLVQGCL